MSFRIVKQDSKWDLEPQVLQQLVSKLRLGDKEQIVPIIKAHITLANKIAGWYTQHHPYRREDLYGVAFEGLAEGVNRAGTTLVDDNITPYLARTIKGKIQNFLVRDSLIPIPKAEFKTRVENEDPLEYAMRTNLNGNSDSDLFSRDIHGSGVVENMAFILPLTDHLQENIDIPVFDYSLQKMDDLYNQMHLNEEEMRIADMRLDGMTLEEIGQTLGMSKVAIHYKVQDIKQKLAKLNLKTARPTPIISGTKVCSRCNNELSLSFFYKIGEGSYKSECKNCLKEKRHEKTASIC